jgi:hypothetical protein
MVQTLMLAAKATDAVDLATLIDAPETARIRVVQDDWLMPPVTATEQSLTGQFFSTVGQFISDWIVVEISFDCQIPLSSLRFGNSAGRAAWNRYWRGEIRGVVAFNTPPCDDVRAGTSSLLALRGGFGGYKATYAQRKAAVGAGLNYGVDWATVIIIR